MNMCKRGLAWLLALLMLTMAIPFGGISVAATESLFSEEGEDPFASAQELQLGVEAYAVIDEMYGTARFLFTPEETAMYRFSSAGEYDTAVELFCVFDDGDRFENSDDDSGIDMNFLLDYELQAGQLYFYEARFLNDRTGSFPVLLEKTGETTCDEVLQPDQETTVRFGANGERASFLFTPESDGSYDFAVRSRELSGGVRNPDGMFVSREPYDDYAVTMHFYCTLEAGVTYRFELYHTSFGEKGSAPVSVSKMKAYTSIEFHDLTLREGLDAVGLGQGEDANGTAHYFSLYNYVPSFTVTWEDGSKTQHQGYFFRSSEGEHHLSIEDTQSYEHPWKVGVPNTVTVRIGGSSEKTYTFAVTLTESPIASVEVADSTYIEHTNGSERVEDIYDENWEWIGQESYYHYYCSPEDDDYIVTMRDGSVFYGIDFEWNGEQYHLPTMTVSDQSSFNPLVLGANDLTTWCAGHFVDYTVHIVETPVASVVTTPVYIVEGQGGYITSDSLYDENGMYVGQSPEYMHYYAAAHGIDPDGCTITLKDGTVIRDDCFEYEGVSYQAYVTYEQRYENRLVYGTNLVPANVAGFAFNHAFEVIDTPVVSVEIARTQRLKERDGYFTTGSLYDDEGYYIGESPEYFHYYKDYVSADNCIITMKDGTVIHDTYFNWNGLSDQVACYQNYETRLLPGVNVISATIAGFEFTFEIEVLDTLVASVEVPRVVLREGLNGSYTQDMLYDEYGNYIGMSPQYFHYNVEFVKEEDCVITLTDGTVINGTSFLWGDEFFYLEYPRQGYDTRLLPGINLVTASICGYEFQIEVEVLESPVASVEVQTPIRIQNANGSWTTSEMWDDQGNYLGRTPEYFHYNSILPNSDTVVITLKDGTVIHGGEFEWEGEYYNVSTAYEQTYDNRLLKGKNTVFASVLGYTFYYEVEVVDSPVIKVETDVQRLIENEDGYFTTSSMYDENGNWIGSSPEYFYYHGARPGNIRFYLSDGTVIEGGSFEWNGEWYSPNYPEQWYETRLVLGRNERTATLAGYEFTYVVEVVGVGSNEFCEYQIGADGVIITNWYQYGETLEIPAEIDGKPVIEVTHLGWSDEVKHIIFPDSVQKMTADLGAFSQVESVAFGAGIDGLSAEMFDYLWKLTSVTVPAGHPDYYVSDGDLYTAAGELLFDHDRKVPIHGCSVHNWPYKTTYFCGEELDLTGMEVVLWRADGSQSTVYTGFTAVGFDSTQAGSYTIDVYYEDTYLGCYSVNVISCSHAYDNACDADCNFCGAVREVPDHVYSYPCTPYCEICGISNENIVHSYLSDCHEVCYNCGEPRLPIADHSYDDEFDTDCNACGAVREVPPTPDVTPGDANGDGRVNNRDLGILQQYLNEWDVKVDILAADLNGDGRVNNRDLGMLQKQLNE